jgi:predicted DNA-binding transcriptional regulator AlpA
MLNDEVPDRFLLPPKVAAPAIGRTKQTLKAWRRAGTGPEYVVLPRGRVAYTPESIRAWIASRTCKGTSDPGAAR